VTGDAQPIVKDLHRGGGEANLTSCPTSCRDAVEVSSADVVIQLDLQLAPLADLVTLGRKGRRAGWSKAANRLARVLRVCGRLVVEPDQQLAMAWFTSARLKKVRLRKRDNPALDHLNRILDHRLVAGFSAAPAEPPPVMRRQSL